MWRYPEITCSGADHPLLVPRCWVFGAGLPPGGGSTHSLTVSLLVGCIGGGLPLAFGSARSLLSKQSL